MRHPIAAFAASLIIAMLLVPAVAGADEEPPPDPVEATVWKLASETSTQDRTPFDFKWHVDHNGIVPIDIEGEGQTLTPEEEAALIDVLSALAGVSKGGDDVVSCSILAEGAVESIRPMGGLVTDHLAEVTWTVECTGGDGETGTQIDVTARTHVYDRGLNPAGDAQEAKRKDLATGIDSVEVRSEVPLLVDVVEANNVHGHGSDRGMQLELGFAIRSVWYGTLCLETYGRQGTGIEIHPVACSSGVA